MNFIALTIGILTAVFIIYRFKSKRWETTLRAYSLLISSFPLYYVLFALLVQDFNALYYELFLCIVFIPFVFLAYKTKHLVSLVLLATLSISHAIYDYFHNQFFINTGTPFWWLEFCSSIDIILAVYLVYLALQTQKH